jgi:hypothetical protein
MPTSTFTRCGALAFLATAALLGEAGGLSAQEPSTFIIAAGQGYGVEDCLAEGGECGHAVANAWCEAHGRGEALKFGRSEGDQAAGSGAADMRPYFITCGD